MDQNKLSIKYLMIWSLGVAGVITARRLIRELEISAQAAVRPIVNVGSLNVFDMIVAAGYGTGISLGVIAIFGGKGFWRDPGRILITILAIIAVIDLLLTTFSLSSVIYSQNDIVGRVRYTLFSPTYGYCFSVLVMLVIVGRSRTSWTWRLAWVSILIFSLWQSTMFLVTAHLSLLNKPGVLAPLQDFYWSNWELSFFIGTTIAIAGILFAIVVDVARRQPIGWLTIAGSSVLAMMWCAVNAQWLLK